jgi:hypothetical protein
VPHVVDPAEDTIPIRRALFGPGGWTPPTVPDGLIVPRPDPLHPAGDHDQEHDQEWEHDWVQVPEWGLAERAGVAPGPIDWEAVAADYRRRHHLDQDGQPLPLGPHTDDDGNDDDQNGPGRRGGGDRHGRRR